MLIFTLQNATATSTKTETYTGTVLPQNIRCSPEICGDGADCEMRPEYKPANSQKLAKRDPEEPVYT